MYLFQTYKKAYFHVSKCGISYKINLIYSRSTIEPTSVPCYCASVERTLDVYEKLVPNIQIKFCEQDKC